MLTRELPAFSTLGVTAACQRRWLSSWALARMTKKMSRLKAMSPMATLGTSQFIFLRASFIRSSLHSHGLFFIELERNHATDFLDPAGHLNPMIVRRIGRALHHDDAVLGARL